MLIHSFSTSASLHWLLRGEPVWSHLAGFLCPLDTRMRPKSAGKLLHSNDLAVLKDLKHILTSDPVPELPSAMQLPICHVQGKGERRLAVVFSGKLTAFSHFRERKVKCFWGPCLKCTHRLKHSPLKQDKIYHSFSTKLLPSASKFISQLCSQP